MNMKFPRRSWHLWRLQGVSLVYECTDPRYFGRYEIDLREITSSAKMLDLIFQIAAGKVWATNPTFSTRGLRQRFWWGEGVRKRVASKGRVGNSPVV